ncbi:DUF6973 domain-containing protein [Flavicella sediminum]|uniref:DUF6973 domain-containing protein n=1 Tax=Flavicella sediminum TaxID=2585141 RepID=UPI001FB7CE86|nr:hypothetical protein [Flavicella sediminum]
MTQKFSKLSKPEKCWVYLHLFKAKKAFKISMEAEKTADSIQKTRLLDQDKNGGQVDAFRHAYWMYTLAKKIGKRAAKSLGEAHEKGNYQQFKNAKLENGAVADEASSKMDLANNEKALELYKEHKKISKTEIIKLLISEIKKGNFKILNKNNLGDYLDCNNYTIPKNELEKTWKNNKCLIPSKLW